MDYSIDPDDLPAQPSVEQCFVFFDGQLRANNNGRKRFGDRFRRAGFNIDKISTFDQLEAALVGSWYIVMADLERQFEARNAGKDSHDHRVLRARYRGDHAEAERLHEVRDRSRKLGLSVVAKGPAD